MLLVVLAGCAIGAGTDPVQPGVPRATPATSTLARDIFAELIAIDTTPSGSTFAAAQAMAKRLVAAGYPEADVRTFEPSPGRGNLVARLRGTGKKKPLLLVAHIDVVPAARDDWATNPFELVEKDGFFYGRGTTDDKFHAAAFVAALVRFKQEGYRPDRDIILVLETDEEIGDSKSVGIRWLLTNHRDLIDAEFAINEGAWLSSRNGTPLYNGIQVAEKGVETFVLEVRNPGGHSSRPRKDNAIYELSAAVVRVGQHEFPIDLSHTREYLELIARTEAPPIASAIRALLSDPNDPAAAAAIAEYPAYNAAVRTTCVATQFNAGFASGALATVARAIVDCRILPGQTAGDVERVLAKVIGPNVSITPTVNDPATIATPMKPEVLTAVKKLTAKTWPGTPVVPIMSVGATDSLYLRDAGIPAFGHIGLESDIDDFRMHGKDERVRVSAFNTAHEYLYRLVKLLAGGR
jgi:acetylornithine deacetylase/succinyl-diaminopimelate desuccinylase-like protein